MIIYSFSFERNENFNYNITKLLKEKSNHQKRVQLLHRYLLLHELFIFIFIFGYEIEKKKKFGKKKNYL